MPDPGRVTGDNTKKPFTRMVYYWRGYRNPTALLGRSMKLSINGFKTINFEKKETCI